MTEKSESENFTQEGAEKFVKELLEDVFPHGKIERMLDFYWPDVVGHDSYDEPFGFEDIKCRIELMRKESENPSVSIKNIQVINDLILFSSHSKWINKNNNKFYENLGSCTYRIKNRKISELWIVSDSPTPSYKEGNKSFSIGTHSFELNEKAKRKFFEHITTLLNHEVGDRKHLSPNERECLYYYLHGFSSKEAAQFMKLSPRTIEFHLVNIKERYACPTKRDLRRYFLLS